MDYSFKEDMIEVIFEKAKAFILPSKSNNYKSRFIQSNLLLYCLVLLLILKISVTLISINIPQNTFFADITKSALQGFVNQTRLSMGLAPLSENAKLDAAAQLKAENMVQGQYFNHTSPTGISPWYWFTKAGYTYKYAGENLAIGFYDSQEVYNAWLNSPSHKANIVNSHYTEVGTAVLNGFGSNNTIIVVQEFGSPLMLKTGETNTTKPAQTSTNNTGLTAGTNTKQRVLSQETEVQSYMAPQTTISAGNNLSKMLNFVFYNYETILQDVVYGAAVLIMGALLVLLFSSFHINFKKTLVLRALIIIILLSVTALVSKELIISLIPHQIII